MSIDCREEAGLEGKDSNGMGMHDGAVSSEKHRTDDEVYGYGGRNCVSSPG